MIPGFLQKQVLVVVREKEQAELQIESARPASGGCINQGWHLRLSNGLALFLKYNANAPPLLFECEANGLAALTVDGGVRVPKCYAHTQPNDAVQFLLLEDVLADVQPAPPDRVGPETLGRRLAIVHGKTGEVFGQIESAGHNYLALTHQPNNPTESWADFFIEQRLRYMLGLLQNSAPTADLKSFHQFLPKAHAMLAQHKCKPSTVHGDLWSGNVLFTPGGEPVLIDPAAYFGDGEVDLAMTRLFGGFDEKFYRAYTDTWSLPEGWRERQNIYNLYHVLHHALLFGGSYMAQARAIIARY